MLFQSPGDVLLTINGFDIYTYGVIMALACLVGIYTSYLIYRKYHTDFPYDKFIDMAPVVLIIGILGARLYYCLLNPVYYFSNPMEIFNFRQGGLSIHGGIIFGIIALIICSKKYKLGCFKVLDAFACGLPLAQAVGRWGNFFNSEAFGVPTNLPWKLYIPEVRRPEIYADYEFFHPTFLYESLLDLCIFCVLVFAIKKLHSKYEGCVFFLYLFLYSVVRFFIEMLRVDSALNITGIPVAQIVSVIILIIALSGILYLANRSNFVKNK